MESQYVDAWAVWVRLAVTGAGVEFLVGTALDGLVDRVETCV